MASCANTGSEHYYDILQTAKYFFNTKGFDQTTCRDITEHIGISDVELLHCFNSLDEILEVIWSES